MIFLRFCAGLFVWLTILAYLILLSVLTWWCIYNGQEVNAVGEETQHELRNIGYALIGFTIVNFIIVFCCCYRINLAIAVLKTSTMFVRDVISIVLVPFVIWAVCCGFYAIWIVGFIYLYSIGDYTQSTFGPFASVEWSKSNRYCLIYWIFGGL